MAIQYPLINNHDTMEIEPFVEESEIEDAIASDFEGIVIQSTDWTCQTLIDQIEAGNIDLNPQFQRRSIWKPQRQSLFIESAIVGVPIPQIILAEASRKNRGQFIVIDGKQRLLALHKFGGTKDLPGSNDKAGSLKLTSIPILSTLNGRTFSEIEENPETKHYITNFANQTIRTIVIRNWSSFQTLHEIFHRMNNGSEKLSPQELRIAYYRGSFTLRLNNLTKIGNPVWTLMKLNDADPRMRDMELYLRLIAQVRRINAYNGNLRLFLDDTLVELNNIYDNETDLVESQISEINESITLLTEIFGNNIAKLSEGSSQINRAALDPMVYYFVDPNIRNAAKNHFELIREAFLTLRLDPEFIASTTKSTKDKSAFKLRYDKWRGALEQILQVDLPVVLIPVQ